VFLESSSEPLENPAAEVAWVAPRLEDVDHQDHRRVHVTLMASHLDIAGEHAAGGDGVGTKAHVSAAAKHNQAAGLHIQADQDEEYVKPAVKASAQAYAASRGLVRRTKKRNMVPQALQPNKRAKAAVQELVNMPAIELAPEALKGRVGL